MNPPLWTQQDRYAGKEKQWILYGCLLLRLLDMRMYSVRGYETLLTERMHWKLRTNLGIEAPPADSKIEINLLPEIHGTAGIFISDLAIIQNFAHVPAELQQVCVHIRDSAEGDRVGTS